MSYDWLGNITAKSDTGTYTYPASGGARPHAVFAIAGALNASFTYDARGNMPSDGSRTLTWTSYNMISTIAQGAATVTGVNASPR